MYLTGPEARKQLGISREKFRQLVRSGELAAHKVSTGPKSHYRVSPEAIKDYLDRQAVRATS